AGVAPDLIVLDLLYQGQPTGLESIVALRADARFQTMPIVVCTGASDIVGRQGEALAALDVGVVLKPFDIETLLAETARRLRPASFTEMAGGTPEPVRRGDGRISETG
ncbi:MAG TPA: hypothetical protein VFX03_04735, partial [Thermomicrobiales bacterium]|nr:hypothetical protein [Thermomicrobiales bacterium]